MSGQPPEDTQTRDDRLVAGGYWVARAAQHLKDGKYSSAVRLCRQHLTEAPHLLSGRIIYAIALYRAGQTKSAAEQFHHVLTLDPENLVALKYLGDIKFAAGDELTALANYSRVLEIDPFCRGLTSSLKKQSRTETHIITLSHGGEPKPERFPTYLRPIPFFTETMGDLYLNQGYPRLAAAVYRRLVEQTENPRLSEKLAGVEKKLREKDH
jgi:tetratricopeptide (TPR) repeat protein